MARYRGSVCRLCRREGEKLFLKSERCYTDKCAIERRPYSPGQHGSARRGKLSDYGIHLREKQKVKHIYSVLERQFRRHYSDASTQKGITGENLLRQLELRLDNVVFRMGFASSRIQARQLVNHGHVTVNGRNVNIPSCILKKNDNVEIKQKSREINLIKQSLDVVERNGIPQWIQIEKDNFKGTIVGLPSRSDITAPIKEQLIVEFYSK